MLSKLTLDDNPSNLIHLISGNSKYKVIINIGDGRSDEEIKEKTSELNHLGYSMMATDELSARYIKSKHGLRLWDLWAWDSETNFIHTHTYS